MAMTMEVGFPDAKSFDALHAQMQGFMSGAALQWQPGGHALAMPCWTIIPPRYHAPPAYDFSKHTPPKSYRVERRSITPSETDPDPFRKYIVQDEYGVTWEVDAVSM
jgi:hypothetical protein